MNYIIYHHPCFDGFTAAWAASKNMAYDKVYVPWTHGQGLGPNKNDDNPGFEKNSDLFFLDCAPNPLLLAKLQDYDITIIDHHRSNFEDHGRPEWGSGRDNVEYYFDLSHSGAALTWEYFNNRNAPDIIRYVEDRDLWRFQLPNTKEIHAFMGCFPWTFEAWDEIDEQLTLGREGFVEFGKAVLQKDKRVTEDLIAGGKQCKYIGGYLVPVVNCPKQFGSELSHELLARYPDAKFSAYYWDRGDGRREYGLRSRGDFDVSEIARLYDGGGHSSAAGFQVSYGDDLNLESRAGAIKLG